MIVVGGRRCSRWLIGELVGLVGRFFCGADLYSLQLFLIFVLDNERINTDKL